jgi:peptidyl-prolyl cis-trans isomerase SurA
MSVPSSMRELCWSLALLSSCSLALAQQVETLDRIVAVINGDVVTSVELERETRIAVETLRRQGTSLPQRDVLERQLLERLVSKQVLLQVARQTGLRVADAEVDAALERIAAENKMKSVADLRVAVEQSGVPFDKFLEDLRSEILISRLREREVEGKINVTDAEIQNFLRAQEAQAERVDEYRLAHILVSVPEQATPEQLKLRRDRAETALAQLKQGVDFRQVAAGYSDAPDALQGGDMGWRPAGRLPGIFLTALKGMKIGQDSDILRSPAGFHIVRLTDKRGNDTPVMVVQTHARHILIRLNELVSENEARTRLAELKDRIEHGADFADLARLHSNDASAVRGGDLGWLSPGDTVPEFERAIRPLKPSQVSDPFKSAFGWHIVQVLERREHDMSKDRQRMTARQAIRARKSDEQWAEWVRQQRDKAYVEIKLEEK